MEKQNADPVLGATWQAGRMGKCLPCAEEKPRFVISPNKLERYKIYMKDHALICKFVGVWPSKETLPDGFSKNFSPKDISS